MSVSQTFRPGPAVGPIIQRRAAIRYALRAPVAFCWVDDAGITRHGRGRTVDVSMKGISVLSSTPLAVGTSVAINIDVPLPGRDLHSLHIEIEGLVVRAGPSGVRSGFCVRYNRVTCPD
jgi:hypothetical protein